MESCKRSAGNGWNEKEAALLFSAAQRARSEGRALRCAFESVAAQTGRKPNSVRNYYYECLRAGQAQGTLERSAAFVPFEREEELALLRTMLTERARGQSVRACALNMGKGDTRLMLRYQNKYRALIKNEPALVRSVLAELAQQGIAAFDPYAEQSAHSTDAFCRGEARRFFAALERLAAEYKSLML